jgi:phosphoesterase RecJ-like protein
MLETTGRVVLTTHLNADGDGIGSEAAIARFLVARGATVTVVNPTPVPPSMSFLLDDFEVHAPADPEGARSLLEADLLLIVDTSEASRLGVVANRLATSRVAVIDHHPASNESLGESVVRDTTACATGELIYDLITLGGAPLGEAEAIALYVAIVTDTGSFRFSNTSPRAHQIAAHLLAVGVDPADLYRRLYAQQTAASLKLIRAALDTLVVDQEHGISWITLTHEALREAGAQSEDAEGLVEYPRRIRGIEVALLFRELGKKRTKVSLRSNGARDVAGIAQELGGGGHPKAAGVLIELPVARATEVVVEAVRVASEESHG